jgi:chromosome partitioning protein
MAKIITVAHQKGGVGKSTLALNLAYRFGKNVRTALTDTDPQGSTMQLQSIVQGIDIIPFDDTTFKGNYDIFFVDTPPYIMNTMMAIFLQSDLVLIPTKAGVPDIMAIRETVGLVRQAQTEKPELKAGIVLNMVKPRANITEQAREQLKEYGLPILAEVGDRVSYTNTFLTGGVDSGNDETAKREIDKLVNEILGLL